MRSDATAGRRVHSLMVAEGPSSPVGGPREPGREPPALPAGPDAAEATEVRRPSLALGVATSTPGGGVAASVGTNRARLLGRATAAPSLPAAKLAADAEVGRRRDDALLLPVVCGKSPRRWPSARHSRNSRKVRDPLCHMSSAPNTAVMVAPSLGSLNIDEGRRRGEGGWERTRPVARRTHCAPARCDADTTDACNLTRVWSWLRPTVRLEDDR